ncbi:MAG: hypothetical protein AMK75_03670 [Planctomycetes bacterium SM23_65]|nr:MAG: hypothetical protein AMK75_03670 [Planctomycetes bacterium SM23_65]
MWGVQVIGLGMMFVPVDIIGRVVNDITAWEFGRFWIYAVLVVANEVLRFGIGFARALLNVRACGRAEWDMQVKLYDALQRMGLSYHDRESSGQLISRMIMDMRFVGSFFRTVIFTMMEAGIIFLVGMGYLFYKSWVLALWSLLMLPVAGWLIFRFATTARLRFYDVRQQYGDLTNVLSENIAGVQVVRGFAREDDQTRRFEGQVESLIDKLLSAMRVVAWNAPLYAAFITVGLAVTLFIGGNMVLGRPMDKQLLGMVISFFFALRIITMRLSWLGRGVSHAQRAIASADRIFELLDERPEIRDKPDAETLREGPGRVVFENVSFGYSGDSTVLTDVDLTVEPGQMVALVGRTGSGKSTLVSLLPRFYDVTRGRVVIDGQDVRDVTMNSLRSSIGLVFQDSFLFSRSVAENIAYANPDADMQQIIRTAEAARAHDFVQNLPSGYDTVIGERGVTLSGGQRQRLTIARALMKDPRILILDDSTSSVDPTTEREIHEAMMHLAKYRTTFVIAHRLSTVRRADLIVVLEDGHIAEMGSHDELMEQGGLYRTICDLQFGLAGGPAAIRDDTEMLAADEEEVEEETFADEEPID